MSDGYAEPVRAEARCRKPLHPPPTVTSPSLAFLVAGVQPSPTLCTLPGPVPLPRLLRRVAWPLRRSPQPTPAK